MDKENAGVLLSRQGVIPWLLIVGLLACHREPPRMRVFPSRMLWAWESPQDLRFLKQGEGVAFLSGEIHLEGEVARWQPRRNPLRMNPSTPLMAVIRVETHAAILNDQQGRDLIQRSLQCLSLPGVMGLQIDFDATQHERAWYARVLRDLRAALPDHIPLSITALGSWCWDDPWIANLPVDEAVPMLFRMSANEQVIRRRLSQRRDVKVQLARHCWGVSTDEPLPKLRGGRRIYVFHPGPWTEAAWSRIRGSFP